MFVDGVMDPVSFALIHGDHTTLFVELFELWFVTHKTRTSTVH